MGINIGSCGKIAVSKPLLNLFHRNAIDIVGALPKTEAHIPCRTGERTPLVPLQACAGRAETVNSNAHPRILLPQNRCLPEPFAAPFPRQPEPRCNTLDFASKVVCQRDTLWKPCFAVMCTHIPRKTQK